MCTPQQRDAVRAAPRSRCAVIDFGTFGTGFTSVCISAAASNRSAVPRLIDDWPDQPYRYPKNRSAILYKGRSPYEYGWKAIKTFEELPSSDRNNYVLFKDFKLALQDADKAQEITSRGFKVDMVIADYLNHWRSVIRRHLLQQGMKESELSNLQWCMTVPAMWTDENKATMRRAAQAASIIQSVDSDQLSFILEPEAAALHARETRAPPLQRGDTVCILDIGGGTADITVHDVEERGGKVVLAEALHATGAMCGGAYVDRAFMSVYKDRVGHQEFDAWAAAHPAQLLQVMQRWMTLKHEWAGPQAGAAATGGNQDDDDDDDDDWEDAGQDTILHRIFIPPTLHSMMTSENKARLQQLQGNTNDVVLTDQDMTERFDVAVDTIIDTTAAHLEQLGYPCSTVILAGGFAASKYLQSRLKAELEGRNLTRSVVLPPTPESAVLLGAAIYGACPDLIRARRARQSYGIKECAPWSPGAPTRFWHQEEGQYYTDAEYRVLVHKGQQVEVDEEVTHLVVPLHRGQQTAAIKVYTTDDTDKRFVVDGDGNMQLLGELTVELPQSATTMSPNSRASSLSSRLNSPSAGMRGSHTTLEAALAALNRTNMNNQHGNTSHGGGSDGYDSESELPQVCVQLHFGRTELMASAYETRTREVVQTRFRFARMG